MKNKGLIILLAILGILVIWIFTFQRGLVNADLSVKNAWGKVQSAYQARYDKIPSLVETVKGAANFEKSTLEAVINARASATQMKLDAKDLTPEKLREFQAQQGQLSQALGRLMVVSEQYPQLKANQNFLNLQNEISDIENKIKRERDIFTDAVQVYNGKGLRLPGSLIAGMFGFKEKPSFESEKGAEKRPDVKF